MKVKHIDIGHLTRLMVAGAEGSERKSLHRHTVNVQNYGTKKIEGKRKDTASGVCFRFFALVQSELHQLGFHGDTGDAQPAGEVLAAAVAPACWMARVNNSRSAASTTQL